MSTWEKTRTRGETIGKGHRWETVERQEEWSLEHRIAGPDYVSAKGSTVCIGEKISAGGPQAFGGAKTWPYVKAETAFPTGCDKLADELAALLRETILRFVEERGLR
jgi:hypothetical protein